LDPVVDVVDSALVGAERLAEGRIRVTQQDGHIVGNAQGHRNVALLGQAHDADGKQAELAGGAVIAGDREDGKLSRGRRRDRGRQCAGG
jgi:hypothetical protein